MSQEERLMILQMVADKKVTALEATELLRALDGGAPNSAPITEFDTPVAVRKHSFSTPIPPTPPRPPMPPTLSGLGAFIEGIVEKVSSVITEATEPRYEFPSEITGEWTGDEVPIRIVTGNGRVSVCGWDEPGYRATIVTKVGGASEAEARTRSEGAYIVTASATGFDLEARKWDFSNIAVHVSLQVPKSKLYRLEARTGNGKVEVENLLLADCKVSSGNGRITMRGGAAERTHLKSGNGAIEVEADVADLEAGSGNGSVDVVPTGNRAQNLRLSTGNGSVRVGTGSLPADFGCRVDAHTGMGGVTVNLPGLVYDREVRSMAHKHVTGQTPNFAEATAAITISARTGLGSIAIN